FTRTDPGRLLESADPPVLGVDAAEDGGCVRPDRRPRRAGAQREEGEPGQHLARHVPSPVDLAAGRSLLVETAIAVAPRPHGRGELDDGQGADPGEPFSALLEAPEEVVVRWSDRLTVVA